MSLNVFHLNFFSPSPQKKHRTLCSDQTRCTPGISGNMGFSNELFSMSLKGVCRSDSVM